MHVVLRCVQCTVPDQTKELILTLGEREIGVKINSMSHQTSIIMHHN